MSKKMVFKINKDGNVVVDTVQGYGSACMEATKFIERALGKADESTRKTTEEYEKPVKLDNTENIQH
jgi:GTP cyclohydrolase III